jgi:thiol:disulfide interchange protein DsbA
MRNLFFSAVLAATSLFAVAAQAADYQAGKQYVELSSPVPVSQPDKIEVVELFWYGCPHCYQFEPTLNAWAQTLPDDVNFIRVPAMFGGVWNTHGQLFLTLEALKVDPQVHEAVFAAIHRDGKKLTNAKEMGEFLAGEGIAEETFLKTFNSFGVKSQMEKAKKLGMAYQVTGVPVLVVNGKYRLDLGSAGGPQQAVAVADFLIERERAAQ